MQYRSFTIATTAFIVAIGGLTATTRLQAQAATPAGSEILSRLDRMPPVTLLAALSRYRVIRWASASPVIRCAPAPLTERPAASAEFARPRVVPLEEAFADAESVQRALALRAGQMAMEN
jgi:hypothetical protein